MFSPLRRVGTLVKASRGEDVSAPGVIWKRCEAGRRQSSVAATASISAVGGLIQCLVAWFTLVNASRQGFFGDTMVSRHVVGGARAVRMYALGASDCHRRLHAESSLNTFMPSLNTFTVP